MLGTLVNTAAVILGSIFGLFLHARLPERLTRVAFSAIGIFTLFLGIALALKTQHILILVFSILPGALLGELIDLDTRLNRLSARAAQLLIKTGLELKLERLFEGALTAFLVFCMGSMTILGALEEGLGRTPNLFFTKSLLDGVAAVALSAGLGAGVLFAAIPLFCYQAGLTLLTRLFGQFLTPVMTDELTAVGGLILIGLGLNLLELKRLKLLNLLPALLIAPLLAALFLPQKPPLIR